MSKHYGQWNYENNSERKHASKWHDLVNSNYLQQRNNSNENTIYIYIMFKETNTKLTKFWHSEVGCVYNKFKY